MNVINEVTARTLISILELTECVNDPPFTNPEIKTIVGRMAKGGWTICAVGRCDLGNKILFSVTFTQGKEEIHVTGHNDIEALFREALKEGHRRYFERKALLPQPGDVSGSRAE